MSTKTKQSTKVVPLKEPKKKNKKLYLDFYNRLDLLVGGGSIISLMALSAYGLCKLFQTMPEQLSVVLTIGVSILLLYAVVRFIAAVKKV